MAITSNIGILDPNQFPSGVGGGGLTIQPGQGGIGTLPSPRFGIPSFGVTGYTNLAGLGGKQAGASTVVNDPAEVQRKQRAEDEARAAAAQQTAAQQAAALQLQQQQQMGPLQNQQSSQAQQQTLQNQAMAGLGAAGPVSSNYTGTPTSPMEAQRQQMELEARFANDAAQQSASLQSTAEARRMSYLPQLLQQLDANGAGGSTSLGMSPEEQQLRDMEFSRGTTRAREWGGGSALSALRALEDYSAGRGQTGSSMERNMAGNIIGEQAANANNSIQDLIQSQMGNNVNRAAGIVDRDYAGNLTKRGQNLGVAQQFLSGLKY